MCIYICIYTYTCVCSLGCHRHRRPCRTRRGDRVSSDLGQALLLAILIIVIMIMIIQMLLLLLLLLLTITHFTEVTLGPGALSTCPLVFPPKAIHVIDYLNSRIGGFKCPQWASPNPEQLFSCFRAHPVKASPSTLKAPRSPPSGGLGPKQKQCTTNKHKQITNNQQQNSSKQRRPGAEAAAHPRHRPEAGLPRAVKRIEQG